jgi:hypothetical protein
MEPVPMLGNPGEPVPTVDPADIKAAWELQRQVEARNPGKLVAIAGSVHGYCSEGADLQAVGYCAAFLGGMVPYVPEVALRIKDGKPDDVLCRAIAEIPMEWIGGGVRTGWPFDEEDFMRRLLGG